jgi:hypothetical protein
VAKFSPSQKKNVASRWRENKFLHQATPKNALICGEMADAIFQLLFHSRRCKRTAQQKTPSSRGKTPIQL